MASRTTAKRQAKRCRVNDLDSVSWSCFLLAQVISKPVQGNGARRANGRPISDSDQRALYRWLKEGNCPSVWSADRFLIRYEAHLDQFFRFCEEQGLEPWATGQAPDWYRHSDVREDLAANDPIWRREAHQELEG